MNDRRVEDLDEEMRLRLHELDGVAVTPYGVLRARAEQPRRAHPTFTVALAAVVLIVLGAIAGDSLRDSRLSAVTSSIPANGDCGAQTSQRDALGRFVAVTNGSTTMLVQPLSELRPHADTWFAWYRPAGTGTDAVIVYAQSMDGSRLTPSLVESARDMYLTRIQFPKPDCWRLHAESVGGAISGDLWLQVLAEGAIANPTYAIADCSATSPRDTNGRLIGATLDTTTIRVGTPPQVRADEPVSFDWQMTSGEYWADVSPLNVYAEYGDGTRVIALSIENTGIDAYRVQLVFPKPGCWRLHSERVGGKISADTWLQVLPRR
ncbi:MAG: hypothetical protein M3082_00500 [Candidatus Dormibacteraeota bacterium]|nr:hypothetical protein [Candidatus Dormibacteraeota bacterium]